jgi:hypothetical protein
MPPPKERIKQRQGGLEAGSSKPGMAWLVPHTDFVPGLGCRSMIFGIWQDEWQWVRSRGSNTA